MKKYSFFIIFLFLLLACSNLSKKLIPEREVIKSEIIKNQCLFQTNQYMFENKYSEELARPLIKTQFFSDLNIIEKGIALTLLELQRKPNAISPNAKVQFVILLNNKLEYFEFGNNSSSPFPLINGLHQLLQNYSKKNLNIFISELDINFPEKLNVDEELEIFINTNKSQIEKNDKLSNLWIRGDDSITHFETYKRPKLEPFINFYLKSSAFISKNEKIISPKFEHFETKNKSNISCNFDFKAEIDQIDINSESSKEKQSFVALKEADNYFMVVTSNVVNTKLKTIDKFSFLDFQSTKEFLPICFLEKSNYKIVLSSIEGRAKSQHLKHIIDYDADKVNSIENLNEILRFSRHLFLTGPDRIIYESKKGRKEQLDFFLTMNFPIYHVENMGNIIGLYKNLSSKVKSSLITDTRKNSRMSCPN